MEFAWTPEQDAYRQRLRSFITASLPSDWVRMVELRGNTPFGSMLVFPLRDLRRR